MPTVNIFYKNLEQSYGPKFDIESHITGLKEFIARELTCNDIKLNPEEVSIRLINVGGDGMIGNVEVEIVAHSFKERVEKQDQICLNVAKYLEGKGIKDVKVWLLLVELGHSWE